MKKRILAFALALLLTASLTLSAGAVTIEQQSAAPPEFSIYLYETGADLAEIPMSEITAHYDGKPMTVTGFMPAAEAGASVLYIYALDVSASMPRAVFSAAKTAVLEAFDALGENEELALVAFGDKVEVRLSGGESREEAASVLDSLSPDSMNTDFYGAVDSLIELSRRSGAQRKIGVIISDGVDDFYAGLTRAELEAKLRDNGISVNAMCINGVDGGVVSSFGEFARLSGGELFLFDAASASEKLSELIERVNSCYVLKLRSATNITDGKAHAINFKLGSLPAETVEVTPTQWIADAGAPRVLEAVFDGEALTITVAFSEPVTGADSPGAFSLMSPEGGYIKLAGVSYAEQGESPRAVLTLEQTPYDGDYILSFSGIRDVSMEENALADGTLTVTLATGLVETRTPVWLYYLIGGIALIVIAAIVLILALNAKRKKRETDVRFSRLENRPIIGQGEQAGSRIIIPKAEGIKVQMSIFDGKGKKYSVTPDIVTSLFIGKHAGNDLVIEDSRVSRQHAVIEKLPDAVAVQDLNSTNGTFVNGARLQPQVSQRIAAGDELTLGDTTIRIISIS